MEEGMKGKKQRSVTNVFLRYICLLAGGALLWLLVWIGIFIALTATGEVLPANYAELWLNEMAPEIKGASEVTENMIPPECTFGVYKMDGTWLYGTLPKEVIGLAWEQYEANNIYSQGRGYFRFLERDAGEMCIVNYSIIMLYRNTFLRKYLPRVDVLLVIGYIALFLLHTAAVSRHFGKYMGARLAVLNEVTGEIRNQNLEFDKAYSELKEVQEVLDSLYQMKEALKSSLHRQWDLEKGREEQIAALAHDIKTPLTVIRGNAELLAEGELEEEEKEYNRDILQSVEIMEGYLGMLNELLLDEGKSGGKTDDMEGGREEECTHSGQGSENPEEPMISGCRSYRKKEECRLLCGELADRLEEQARLLGAARQCAVLFERKELPGNIRCDESQIIRAFLNIVSNAMDYSPPGKGLRIHFFNREKQGQMYLAAEVMDEGPGFSAEELKYAAERFYRGDKSRSSKVHYGIGLHTARRFAEAQGGYLVMENRVEGGGRVTLYIRCDTVRRDRIVL